METQTLTNTNLPEIPNKSSRFINIGNYFFSMEEIKYVKITNINDNEFEANVYLKKPVPFKTKMTRKEYNDFKRKIAQ